MEGKEIDPSKEENFSVKTIAKQNIINFKFPMEDKSDTIEIEIYLNGKTYIKKEFYLKIKLKYLRTNLKFDETYKIIYKDKALSEDEEKIMTLDELCYKELKVFFAKIKDDNDNLKSSINKLNFSQTFLETKSYPKISFRSNEMPDILIIIGKEKSGKTTFINCLCNYINGIKFEDNFRYLIEAKKEKDYQVYNFHDKSYSQKIKVIEFPGFSGELEEDRLINGNIKKFIKTVNEVKSICFIISGNETRLTNDLKNIFSNVWDIFANDIKKNFLLIITNCDARQPPILDCIKSTEFSKFLSIEKCIYKFNNSYLFDTYQKEFWDAGIAHYKELMDNINKKENISLNLTKKYIELNLEYHNNLRNFIDSTIKLSDYKNYFNNLKNISSYDNASNIDIPFDYLEVNNLCSKCNSIFDTSMPCQQCGYNKNKVQKIQKKYATLKDLKRNNKLYLDCLNTYKTNIKKQNIDSALIYKSLKDFYKLKLFRNSSLKDEIKDNLEKNEIDKKILNQEINYQEILYNKYISESGPGQIKYEYKQFLEKTLKIE